ncbi:unnamed protein product [Rotaria magnacalcarata]|uniref:Peptidase S1 domain-containing protein n=1 Tax=Rotaria magnacalcarata TaxID=392030 RepID=A0A818ZXF3_9BILA|nr:unnamed protein product [Rotaria magnacalcarata]CAF2220016.1 unnamed protein product [Rotaria magnacalcarata]CAF3776397.1 unnamed protein product [Rotaria magnacalcarata]CAF3974577.1 unnamed protein product [Rotaria magnacalcarata]
MMIAILFVHLVLFSVTTIHGQEMQCELNNSLSWTPWFNFHKPNPKGEYELHAAIRSQHPTLVCSDPHAVSAVNQAGVDMNQTLDMIIIRSYDVFCLNGYDPKFQHKTCDDYSVRYCCPIVKNLTKEEVRDLFISGNTNALVDNPSKAAQLKCGRASRAASFQASAGTSLLLTLLNSMVPKIINGVEARPNSWPWLVSIGIQYRGSTGVWQNRTHVCGGTLIDTTHVLTAGHCVEQKIDDRFVPLSSTHPSLESFFILRIGVHDIRATQLPDIYRARRISTHENFISSTFENDIAIIRLDRPVVVSDYASPICLPASNVAPGRKVTVAGWGTVSETARVHSNVLRQANINVLPTSNCRVYTDVHYDGSKQLCAAALDWSKDTCAGDSGGPLMYQDNGVWSIGGITSYGYGCSKRGFPGVYTRTVPYLSWIKTKMLSNH